jgi:hypothetical protein
MLEVHNINFFANLCANFPTFLPGFIYYQQMSVSWYNGSKASKSSRDRSIPGPGGFGWIALEDIVDESP